MRRTLTAALAALVATVMGLTLAGSPAHAKPLKTRSLATVLTSDNNTFDRNRRDFDIATEAVLAVLRAKPDSPVGVLADGTQPLTAFLPTDQAFRVLAEDLTGRHLRSERRVFTTLVSTLGVETIETVLLYHVVPGARVPRRAAQQADGATLATAAGIPLGVNVTRRPPRVRLIDQDRDSRNARVVRFDINKGNRQIAHGIDRVLRPVDL